MRDFIDYLLGYTFLNNTIITWLIALGISGVVIISLLLVRDWLGSRLIRLAQRTETRLDDYAAQLLRQTRLGFIIILGIYLGALALALPLRLANALGVIAIITFLFQIGFWVTKLVHLVVEQRRQEQLADQVGNITTLNAIELLSKGAIWTLVLLLALDNIPGIQVTALIASLGIGGIAIGLAVQNILSDLFASLSIALDKPFVIGDFITVDDFSGTVEYIGLKSTRLRSISGEQVVFGNSDLLSSRIRNFKRMARRRILFTLGVVYQTPSEKLAAIPALLQEIITLQENATFDRAHLKQFTESSILFEVVYFMELPEFNMYMDTQQAVNLAIFQRFEQEGICFAYPTQTIFLKNREPVGHFEDRPSF